MLILATLDLELSQTHERKFTFLAVVVFFATALDSLLDGQSSCRHKEDRHENKYNSVRECSIDENAKGSA